MTVYLPLQFERAPKPPGLPTLSTWESAQERSASALDILVRSRSYRDIGDLFKSNRRSSRGRYMTNILVRSRSYGNISRVSCDSGSSNWILGNIQEAGRTGISTIRLVTASRRMYSYGAGRTGITASRFSAALASGRSWAAVKIQRSMWIPILSGTPIQESHHSATHRALRDAALDLKSAFPRHLQMPVYLLGTKPEPRASTWTSAPKLENAVAGRRYASQQHYGLYFWSPW